MSIRARRLSLATSCWTSAKSRASHCSATAREWPVARARSNLLPRLIFQRARLPAATAALTSFRASSQPTSGEMEGLYLVHLVRVGGRVREVALEDDKGSERRDVLSRELRDR
jgi:hypothetical protein